ncbi:MAG: UvrD-helicase domain-containing protein [Archangium sp.]|nr:UvrD-helicase domain-containing protein [Archangium sp.]
MKVPGDQATRTQLLEDLDTTFVVEAAAGTGKTTVLVERIVMMVRKGRATLSQIISVTFTEKAAGEMKLRLRTRLERAREEVTLELERDRLTLALEELEVARIGTIHGLCADLLREYPVEAGVDPLFEVAAEGDSDALLSAAFHRRFQDLLQTQPEGVRRALRRRQRGPDSEPPRKALYSAVQSLVEHRDFAAPWRRDPFSREAAIDALLPLLEGLAARIPFVKLKRDRSEFLDSLELARRFLDDLSHRESVSKRDYDGLEAQLKELGGNQYRWTAKAWGLSFSGGLTEAQILAERDAVWTALKNFVRLADADLAARLHDELRPIVEGYELEKSRRGVLDFVDLLLLTRNLLRDHHSVRESLQERFKRVFVDEFQDTDPLQSEIVLLLASDDAAVSAPFATRPVPGKLFVVGDPKQSIYRFRRADILLYERVKQHLLSCGAEVLYLSTSFRSTPGIQAAVNAAFSTVMTGEHQATYVPLGEWREPNREQPSVVALPAPRPFSGKGRVTKDAIETSLPEAVGAFVEWLVTRSTWTVEEEGERVPVQARHVCILFKRLRRWGGVDVPRPYAQALEARRVPHVLVGGRSFHQREEVMALRTALFAVDRPDDEFSVYATLRGPFFAFTDEQLFAFKQAHGKLHPLRPWDAATSVHPEQSRGASDQGPSTPLGMNGGSVFSESAREVIDALGALRDLHRKRNLRPVSATVHELLELTRAHAGVAFWTAGAQALANVLQLAEVSRRHERRASSFRDVVEALQEEADDGEAPEAPIVEEGTEGVRMMTVHAAKGLEFPVVILAEPTANSARQEPSHWVDPERGLWVHSLANCVPVELRDHEHEVLARDQEEALRLTYVAATRARDVLVVPVCSEKRWKDAWTEVLYPALYPQLGFEHEPKPAPGCPPFGRDPILDRDGPVPNEVPLPGLHRAATMKNGVVWWDPRTLELTREERTGLEAADALSEDDVEGPRSIAAFEQWQDARTLAVGKGSVPSERITVARELPPVLVTGTLQVEQTSANREGRAAGRRFGELVHACLAVVPLEASEEVVEGIASVMGRSLQAPQREIRAATEAVVAALAHPAVSAARGSADVRREVSLVDHLEDGTIVEGAIDLAYELDGVWRIVEFKTDASIEENRPQYEAQTQAYVRAIHAATGKPARGVILRV